MIGQVNHKPIESVCDRGARHAAGFVVGAEHEMVNEKLRAPSEEVRQGGFPFIGVELIFLVGANPRQFLPLALPTRRRVS
jgi:hypothetical protein